VPALQAVAVALLLWTGPTAVAQQDAGDKLLTRAAAILDTGMARVARQEYRSFLARYPRHRRVTEARYGLAVCHYRTEEYSAAAAQLQQILSDKQFAQQAQAAGLLGQCHLAAGDYRNALKVLEKLLTDHPSGPHVESAKLNIAQTLYMLGENTKAPAAFKKFLRAYPKSRYIHAAHYYIAQCHLAAKQHDKAIEALRASLQADRTGRFAPDATMLLGQCHEATGKHNLAESKYLAFILKAPEQRRAEGYYSLGTNYYRAGKYAKAIEAFQHIVRKFASSQYARAARLQIGLSQFAAGKYTDARTTLGQVAEKSPQDAPTAHYWMSQCERALGRNAEAYAILKRLAGPDQPPSNAQRISFDMAVCLIAMGEWGTAAKDLAQFQKRWPKSALLAEATYQQAWCLHKLKAYSQSNEACRAVLSSSAGETAPRREARELLAENLLTMKEYSQAEEAYASLLKTDAKNRVYLLRWGLCAYYQDKYADAISRLAALGEIDKLAKDPTFSQALQPLGRCQLELGKHAEAAKTFTAYLTAARENRDEATYRLALALRGAGKGPQADKTLLGLFANRRELTGPWAIRAAFDYGYDAYRKGSDAEAVSALAKVAAAKTPDQLAAPTTYMLAWLEFNAARYDRAAERFALVSKRWPAYEHAGDCGFHQAVSLHRAGKHEEALGLFVRYAGDHREGKYAADAGNLAAACLMKLDRTTEATKALSALAAAKETRSASVLYQLAWLRRRRNNIDGAVQTYEALIKEYPGSDFTTTARIELADLLFSEKEYRSAASLLTVALKDKSVAAKAHQAALLRLGECLVLNGQPRGAVATFENFIRQYPKADGADSARYQVAVSYAQLGELPKARKQLTELLRSCSDDKLVQNARIQLADVYAAEGDHKRAQAAYAQFLKKYPRTAMKAAAQYGIARALHNQQKYDDARTWYARVVETDNGVTAAKAQLQTGRTHWAQGDFKQAAKELLKVDILYKDASLASQALYEAAQAFEKLKDIPMALREYGLCVRKYGDTPSGRLAAERIKAIGKNR